MTPEQYADWSLGAAVAAQAELAKRGGCRFNRYFPDDGPLSRDNYPKHLDLMGLGATHRERLFMAANRVGKTDTGAYELTCHLTGLYPTWWTGRRFDRPIRTWAAGDTSTTVRDIIQAALLGPVHAPGTGMIDFVALKRLVKPEHVKVFELSPSLTVDAVKAGVEHIKRIWGEE